MLRQILRSGGKTQERLLGLSSSQPLAFQGAQVFSRDYAQFIDIFRKDKAEERRKKLQEECSQGYWDDFKELKDSGGKVYQASTLIAASAAPVVPSVEIQHADGSQTTVPKEVQSSAVTLLCVAFRGGAEEMLASWSRPFSEGKHRAQCQHLELSIVESAVMSWWPFRGMILKGKSKEAEQVDLKPKYLFHFSTTSPFVAGLQMSNRLTGYVFLLDNAGKVRWRGSGTSSAEEVNRMMTSVDKLVDEHD